MSSPSPSPRVSVSSPPFTPVRSSSTKRPLSSSSPSSNMLLTPGATPANAKNRFGPLSSPQKRVTTRAPLGNKSQNIDSAASATEPTWRRKANAPKTPARSTGNELLPSPFHSTQRRNKFNQNQNANYVPITPVKTPIRAKKPTVPLTPEDSPFTSLKSKLAPLSLKTPPKFIDALLPASPVSPVKPLQELAAANTKSETFATCAACNRVLTSAALLSPCKHLVCSPCLTGCLNAAGEKGMDCMACKMPISTFKLTSAVVSAAGSALPVPQQLAASVAAAAQEAKSAAFLPAIQVQPITTLGAPSDSEESCVLRVDNVPWDVTPEMLADWLGDTQAVFNHALIDRRDGRTLSYAYMEVSADAMKAILRARQNTILGSGRRARAVTITVSTQDELMREIFPSWRGHFLGSKPCVAGMDNIQISNALHEGLMSAKEVEDVLKLLRKPDSHFVKVPTLPYYHLISILRKFPSDKDSKVLHTPVIRQALYNLVKVAADELRARAGEAAFALSPMEALRVAVSQCMIFSQEQRKELATLLREDLRSPASIADQVNTNGNDFSGHVNADLFDLLATTHNVPTGTVQALAQDLLQRLIASNQPSTPTTTHHDTLELPMAVFSTAH